VQPRTSFLARLAALVSAALVALTLASSSSAATREPMSVALAALHGSGGEAEPVAHPSSAALRALESGTAQHIAIGGDEVKVTSSYYGTEQMDAVAAVLRGLDHGPELSELSVYLATPAEIEEICGATVVACYLPAKMEMVVSGEERPVAGVPWEFAIAHEYGHHIANTQRGDLLSPLQSGTIRWATYERVCQFTRRHDLYPGDQGNHYWEDPEEAFAESYAHLTDPSARVSWQYTALLQPTAASLAKIRQDLSRPWNGPVSSTVGGTLAEPSTAAPAHLVAGDAQAGIDSASVVGAPPWIAEQVITTPLDGTVSVSLQAPAGADFAVALRDSESGRVVSQGTTGEGGSTEISYGNCGHASLRLEVRSLHGGGPFQATVVKP